MQIQSIKVNTQTSMFDDKVIEVVNFLNQNYDIRIPLQDPSKIQISCKDKDRYEYQPSFDDLSLHLMSAKINVGDSVLRKIIRSPNYLKPCDPVKEYFDKVRGQWKGKSQIDLLCSHISPRTFDDNTEDFYRERTDKLIRKWMVACVACWLGNKHNDVALGFVQLHEGTGKTELVRFLMPDSISEYYVESSSDERKFDMEDVFTRYMIINFDELVGINKGSFEPFKKCLSADLILNKRRFEEFPTKKPRLGCAAFTTNFNQERGGFISEYWGPDNRRIGAIELTSIDWNYSTAVDKDQMWSEALNLYESTDFDYKFNQVDFDDFALYNSRYLIESEAMKCVQTYMSIPETEEDGERLNASQILRRLIDDKRITKDNEKKVTAQKIGAALTMLGYAKVSFRTAGENSLHSGTSLKGYHVKFN